MEGLPVPPPVREALHHSIQGLLLMEPRPTGNEAVSELATKLKDYQAAKRADADAGVVVASWNVAGVNSNVFEFRLSDDDRFPKAVAFGQTLGRCLRHTVLSEMARREGGAGATKAADEAAATEGPISAEEAFATQLAPAKLSEFLKLMSDALTSQGEGELLPEPEAAAEGEGDAAAAAADGDDGAADAAAAEAEPAPVSTAAVAAGVAKLLAARGEESVLDLLVAARGGAGDISWADLELKPRVWAFTNLRLSNVEQLLFASSPSLIAPLPPPAAGEDEAEADEDEDEDEVAAAAEAETDEGKLQRLQAAWWAKWAASVLSTPLVTEATTATIDQACAHVLNVSVFDACLMHAAILALAPADEAEVRALAEQLRTFMLAMATEQEHKAAVMQQRLETTLSTYSPDVVALQEWNLDWVDCHAGLARFWAREIGEKYYAIGPTPAPSQKYRPTQTVQLLIRRASAGGRLRYSAERTARGIAMMRSDAFLTKLGAKLKATVPEWKDDDAMVAQQVDFFAASAGVRFLPAVATVVSNIENAGQADAAKERDVLVLAAHAKSNGSDNRVILAGATLLAAELGNAAAGEALPLIAALDANTLKEVKAKHVKFGSANYDTFKAYVQSALGLAVSLEAKAGASEGAAEDFTVLKERSWLQMQLIKADLLDRSFKDFVIASADVKRHVRMNRFPDLAAEAAAAAAGAEAGADAGVADLAAEVEAQLAGAGASEKKGEEEEEKAAAATAAAAAKPEPKWDETQTFDDSMAMPSSVCPSDHSMQIAEVWHLRSSRVA